MRSKNNGNNNANKSVSYSNDSRVENKPIQKYGKQQSDLKMDNQQMSKHPSIYSNNPIQSNIYQKYENGFQIKLDNDADS